MDRLLETRGEEKRDTGMAGFSEGKRLNGRKWIER